MISKSFFGRKDRRYSYQLELIENYKEAIEDKENIWECHHKLEAFFTMKELIEMKRYYNVPARELVFCKNEKEHQKWPHKGHSNSINALKYSDKKWSEKRKENYKPENHSQFKGVIFTRSDGVSKFAYEWKEEGYSLSNIRRAIKTGIKCKGYNWSRENA